MKLKILLVPLIILVMILLLIWILIPLSGEVMDARDDLMEKRAGLADLEKKIGNAQKLASEFDNSADKQNVIMKYIPVNQNEEDIINSLSGIASDEQVSIAKLSVVPAKGGKKSAAVSTANPAVSDGSTSSAVAVPKLGKVKTLEANFSVSGSYGKIKSVIAKIHGLKRFNKIVSFSVKKISSGDQSADASSDNLQVEMVLSFNYMERVDSVSSLDDRIFSEGEFDTSVIDQIINLTSVDLKAIAPESAGKGNPFMR